MLKQKFLGFAALAALLLAMETSAQAAEELTGAWRVEAVKGAGPIDSAKTKFLMQADGSFDSTIGCNQIGGRAAITGSKLSFGRLASTMMACEPLMDLEDKYKAALEATRSFRIEGGVLIFADEPGEDVITLTRAP